MVVVEILFFQGCPGHAAAVALVAEVVKDSLRNVEVEVRQVEVADEAAAQAMRFLGSPSVRVNGRDVEPDADARSDYAMQCRVYAVDGRMKNTPPREWIERALGIAR